MSVGTKRMIILFWLLISIAALITVMFGAWDYYQSLKHGVAGSVLMHSHRGVTDPDQLLMEHYLGTLKKSAVYLVINIGVTIFALCNVK